MIGVMQDGHASGGHERGRGEMVLGDGSFMLRLPWGVGVLVTK